MDKDVLNFIGLFYPYADAHTIDRRLDEDPLLLIPGHREWIEEEFW